MKIIQRRILENLIALIFKKTLEKHSIHVEKCKEQLRNSKEMMKLKETL